VIVVPRAFPTQIAGYLSKTFGKPASFDYAIIQSHIGAVAGFLELYDQLPAELIRLSADDYATLITSIATVRYGADQFRRGNSPDCLRPVGPALGKAWELITRLKDEAPSTAHDLSFIKDLTSREMIGLDIAAISTNLQSGEWKGATLLSGSCCEALLLYGLQTRPPGDVPAAVKAITWRTKAPDPADLTDRSWDLFSYTEVAHHLKLISDTTKCELGPARDYRNLIHPAKSIREKVRCDRGTAFVGAGALEHVISDLKKYL
jgi:hypothetical protein